MRNSIALFLFMALFQIVHAQTLKDEWIICNLQGCQLLDPYYSEGATITWDGECVDQKAHGYGTLIKYMNGEYESTYEGEFKNGIREGRGKFSHKDGTVREGQFVNGQLMGKGTMHSADGQKYVGEFVNYRMHGFGIAHFANGAKFEGFIVSDRMYTGKYIDYDGTATYLQAYYPVAKITEKSRDYKPQQGVMVTEYFDENWKRCAQKNALYYRRVTYAAPNRPAGIVRDYYITGELQSEFYAVYLDYDDEGKNFHEGEATWYFKNGRIEQKRYYYNNKINGLNTFYYDNGQVSREVNYDHGKLHREYTEWYKTGNLKLQAIYEHGKLVDNKFIEYDELGSGAIVYSEDFYSNKEKWEIRDDGNESLVTDDNKLKLLVTSKEGFASRGNYITLDQRSNYSIESSMIKRVGKGEDAYGLFFGLKDWDNYFEFLISDQGYYLIRCEVEGISIKIVDWTKSTAINIEKKRNQLKVMKLDDRFIFSINGQIVERIESRNLRGNFFGISAYGFGEYSLERLIVKEFISAEEAQKRKPIQSNDSNPWKGNGSGFFINEAGYIATNYHVIEDAKFIQVEYYQKGIKHVYPAMVIVTDKQNDLAIIQITDPNFNTVDRIPYVFTTQIKDVGTDVFALGYPLANVMGDEVKFTDGKISSKTGIKGDISVYQISVPIQPGNSGGPLFDNKGNLVGITSSALNKEYFNAENVNYAIKSAYLKNLVDVMPTPLRLPNSPEIHNKPLTEKIKLLTDFVPIIKVR